MSNKISQYLNEHIWGEITASKTVRERFSTDGSVLTMMPDLVMFPRVTNDIRKAARFAWQLAEKGHVLPITPRGGGSDATGGAIGKGLIVSTTDHMNNIIHIGIKEKTVHVQPGITFKALNDALSWQGMTVPAAPETDTTATIGGAVASNAGGKLSGKYGLIGTTVDRLEVVLANGDVIETTKLSKREFSHKKGLQTFEGEIYRKLDGLIEDNQELIENKIAKLGRDNAGYPGISRVKDGGSFDLTPLMVGSQGTLGVISELVLNTELINPASSVVVALMPDKNVARDAADLLKGLEPCSLETIDGELYKAARARGKAYPLQSDAKDPGVIVYAEFDTQSDRKRGKKLKKANKLLSKLTEAIVDSNSHALEELYAMREVMLSVMISEDDDRSMPPLIDGAQIPDDRYEEFCGALDELAKRHHVELPVIRRVLDNTLFMRPTLDMSKVSDKQKIFKLISEFAKLVDEFGGSFVSQGGEGRMKSSAAQSVIDEDVVRLYQQVRDIFDPYGTLNPGVKQAVETKDLVAALRKNYN